ncbi:MAG: DUF4249 domain-containing protein [Cyclobacteriaceae bacterium]
MKKLIIILTLSSLSCERVVVIPLPDEQNLLVVEGWLTDMVERQYVRLSRSNSFSGAVNPVIDDATVLVQARNSPSQTYSYAEDGRYLSDNAFQAVSGEEYRLSVLLQNGDLIRSSWTPIESNTNINILSVDSFVENDEENPGQTKVVYFPRITALDSADYQNYYRWRLFKDGVQLTEPESIILQNDRFFDGNFIPNLFDDYEYSIGNNMTVELHSITKEAFDFLSLLKSQTTTLSAAASTTPAIVNGNITNFTAPDEIVLGFFGTRAISSKSVIVQ